MEVEVFGEGIEKYKGTTQIFGCSKFILAGIQLSLVGCIDLPEVILLCRGNQQRSEAEIQY